MKKEVSALEGTPLAVKQDNGEHINVPAHKRDKNAVAKDHQGSDARDHGPSRLGESGTNKREQGSQRSGAGEGVSSREKGKGGAKLNPTLSRASANHIRRENGKADPTGLTPEVK